MKNKAILLSFLLLIGLTSSGQDSSINKFVRHHFGYQILDNKEFTYDTLITGINLFEVNPEQIIKVFGVDFIKAIDTSNSVADLPIYFATYKKLWYIGLARFPGSKCCDYFEVGKYSDSTIEPIARLDNQGLLKLRTGQGIELGIKKRQFLKIRKEVPDSMYCINGYEIYEYNWGRFFRVSPENPLYVSRYIFNKKKRLVKFGIGLLPFHPTAPLQNIGNPKVGRIPE